MTEIYELVPIKTRRKSFYRKAYVLSYNKETQLWSYESLVCIVRNNDFWLNGNVEQKLLFSKTTLTHIREFLYQILDIEQIDLKELKLKVK